jgi:hypothetical protein
MSRNGSGTYTLPQPPFTPGTTIASSAVNSDLSDIAAALTQSISKDGQTVYTGNQPMGGNKLTGLGAGTSPGDSVNVGQVIAGGLTYSAATGTDTITIAPTPGISAYAVGQTFSFKAAATNTGAVTLNVSTVGAGPIRWPNGTALVAGDLVADGIFEVEVADITTPTAPVFHILNTAAAPLNRTGGTLTGTLTMSSASIVMSAGAINEAAVSLGVTNPYPIGAAPANSIHATGGGKSSVVTISIANPSVISWTAHGLLEGTGVQLGTTGALPTGLSPATTYYVFAPTTDAFNLSTVPVGQGGSCTITIASPAVVTKTAHGFTNGTKIVFSTTGALPTGLVAGTPYFVVSAVTDDFQVSATSGGSAINTTGTQSGTQTVVRAIGTSGTQSGVQTATTPGAITAFDTVQAGTKRTLVFDGVLTLTHNATSLILPGAANIVTAAGDSAGFLSLGSGNWKCTAYQRAAVAPGDTAIAFLANKNGVAQSLTDETWAKLTFGTENFDIGGYYDTATSRYTPPAGTYLINGRWGTSTFGAQNLGGVAIYKNGSRLYSNFIADANGAREFTVAITQIMALSGTDYVELWGYVNTAASPQDVDGAAEFTTFSAAQL